MENKFEILKMSAEWCGPCRATKPVFESFSESNTNYICTEVDVDKDGDTAQKYQVKNIPTLIFLKNGEVVKRHVGAFTGSQLDSLASEAFN
jgi:thioredoxin 1